MFTIYRQTTARSDHQRFTYHQSGRK